ncbi:hypothetical protein ACJX0J_032522, partial [Zea mays]
WPMLLVNVCYEIYFASLLLAIYNYMPFYYIALLENGSALFSFWYFMLPLIFIDWILI